MNKLFGVMVGVWCWFVVAMRPPSLQELCLRDATERGQALWELPAVSQQVLEHSFCWEVKFDEELEQKIRDDAVSELDVQSGTVLYRQLPMHTYDFVEHEIKKVETPRNILDALSLIEYMAYAQRLGMGARVQAYCELLDTLPITPENVCPLLFSAEHFHAFEYEARCRDFLRRYGDIDYYKDFCEHALSYATEEHLVRAAQNPVWWCDAYDDQGKVDQAEKIMLRLSLNALRAESQKRSMVKKALLEHFRQLPPPADDGE